MAVLSAVIKKEDLRPVEINSHQYNATGFFHRYMDKNGKTYALVESKYGVLTDYDLETYRLKFTDRNEYPNTKFKNLQVPPKNI